MTPQYMAGFFDGEGTFYLGTQTKKDKVYRNFKVSLAQSGEDGLKLLNNIQALYGGTLYMNVASGKHKATKNAYKLYWNQKEAITLINILKPYLILKAEAANKVLEYITRK